MGCPGIQLYIAACTRSIVLSMLLKGMRLGLDVSIFIVQLIKCEKYHDACLANSVGGVVGNVHAVVQQFQRMLQALKKATADLEKAMGDAPATDAKAPPPPAASDTVKAPDHPLAL